MNRNSIDYKYLVYFGSPLLFIFSPFIAIIINLILLTNFKLRKYGYQITYILISIYLGFINSTKKIESDLENYYEYFKLVDGNDFFEYIFLLGKEPVFMIFNYLVFYLTSGDFKMYIIISTFIPYFLFLSAIHIFSRKLNLHNAVHILMISFLIFLPQLFSISAHLNRQFIASSILIYGIINKFFKNKNSLIYFIIAALIHSSTILFIPLIYWKKLKKNIGVKTIIYIGIAFIIFNSINKLIYNYLINSFGSNIITYVLERAMGTTHELEPIGLQATLFLLFIFFIIIYLYNDSILIDKNVKHLFNITILLFLFIIININQSELAKRFLFYSYIFSPFIIPIAFLRQRFKYFLSSAITIMLIILFWIKIEYGPWTYSSIFELIFQPVFLYF